MGTDRTDDLDTKVGEIFECAAPALGPHARQRALHAMAAFVAESALESPVRTRKREGLKMRHIAFAGIALLAIAIAGGVLIPRAGHKPDARSILIAAVQAAEEAKSVYFVGRGTGSSKATPSRMLMMPGRAEVWVGMRGNEAGTYMRYVTPDGRLRMAAASSINPNTGEWWFYDYGKQTRYVADVTPIADKAGQVVAESAEMLRSKMLTGGIAAMLAERVPDLKKSVTYETRDGRKVAVVTITFTARTSPTRVTERMVTDVDAETKHLLSMRQYAQAEGAEEELVGAIDRVEYDVPVPADLAAVVAPEGTKTVRGTASIEETEKVLSLVMKADGVEIVRTDVPRSGK